MNDQEINLEIIKHQRAIDKLEAIKEQKFYLRIENSSISFSLKDQQEHKDKLQELTKAYNSIEFKRVKHGILG